MARKRSKRTRRVREPMSKVMLCTKCGRLFVDVAYPGSVAPTRCPLHRPVTPPDEA